MAEIVAALGVPWLVTTLLLSVRVAAVFLMTPVLYAVPVPATVRVLMLLGISTCLAAGLAQPATSAAVGTPGALLAAAASEAAIGATLGLGILLAFAGFAVAGRILDIQVGFGIAQVFDPLTRTQVPVLTSVLGLAGLLLFFLADGHHMLLRGLAYSAEKFPVGRTWSLADASGPVLRQAGALFTLGFALVAPVILCLLLVEFALGVIARNLPQVNMFVLGIPVKIVVGLLALSLWTGGMGAVASRIYAGIYETWDSIFAAAPVPAGERR